MTSETKNERPSRSGLFGGHGRTHPDVFFLFLIFFLFSAPSAKKKQIKIFFFFCCCCRTKENTIAKKRPRCDFVRFSSRFCWPNRKKIVFVFFHREKLIKMIPQADLWVRLFIARKDVANTAASRRRLFFFICFFFWVSLLLSSHVLFFVSFLQRAH